MLTALQKDIVHARAQGLVPQVSRHDDGEGVRIEVRVPRLKGLRTTRLEPAEFELLCALPGVREALATQVR